MSIPDIAPSKGNLHWAKKGDVAMGQNPVPRAPSEHQPIPTKIGPCLHHQNGDK